MIKIRDISDNSAAGAVGAFMIALGAGFLLSGTDMAGVASFADISVAGALNLPAAAAVLTGSLLHSVAVHSIGRNIVKIAAMVLIVITKMFYDPHSDPKTSGIISGVCVFAAGSAVSAIIGEMMYKLVFYLFYGSLTGVTVYSASYIVSGLRRRSVFDLSSGYGCAYAVVYTVLISSLCSVRNTYVNVGLICGICVTLLAAYYYRHTGGVLCGALTTCGAFLSSSSCGMSVVLLPAAGLLTGYLNRRRNTSCAVFFTGISFVLSVLAGVTYNSLYNTVNYICAAAAFMLISPSYSDKWITTGHDAVSALPEMLGSRMGFLSDSIETVRGETLRISKMLDSCSGAGRTVNDISGDICGNCAGRRVCWNERSGKTAAGLRKLSVMTEFSAESFPRELERCIRKKELSAAFRRSSRERTTARLLALRYSDSQKLLCEQIRIMEELIDSAGERLDVRYSEPISKQIVNKLVRYGYTPGNVIAYYNSRNRLHVEIYFPLSSVPENFTRVRDLITDELKMPLENAQPVYSGKEARLRVYESPAYKAEICGAARSAGRAADNGDTSAVFDDGTGVCYAVLSDGMGTGQKAAFESRMVVTMFRKLVGSGVSCLSAVKMINSIMLTKSPEETFATFDAVRIDLDTCRVTVIKSGAAATLIRRRGSVMRISSQTFPVGIYEESDTFSQEHELEPGDVLIMCSDGVNENEYKYIKELLLQDGDLQNTVDEICRKSKVFNPSAREDDVTVIGIRIRASSEKEHK